MKNFFAGLCFLFTCLPAVTGCLTTPKKEPPTLIGTWGYSGNNSAPLILTFKENNRYELDFEGDGQKDIWGEYNTIGNRLQLTDHRPREITDCYDSGFYYFFLEENSVEFELLADQCVPRTKVMKDIQKRIKKEDVDNPTL